MAHKLYLASFSQHGAVIEIRPSARVFSLDSSTPSIPTEMENLNRDISRTLFKVERTQDILMEVTTISSISKKHVSVDAPKDQVPS